MTMLVGLRCRRGQHVRSSVLTPRRRSGYRRVEIGIRRRQGRIEAPLAARHATTTSGGK